MGKSKKEASDSQPASFEDEAGGGGGGKGKKGKGKKDKGKKEKKEKKSKKSKKGQRDKDIMSDAFENPLTDEAAGQADAVRRSADAPSFEDEAGRSAGAENPAAAETGDGGGPVIPELAVAASDSPVDPRLAEDDISPRFASPTATDAEAFDRMDYADKEKRTGRDACSYCMLTTGTMTLMPIYALFALFMVWVAWLVPNPMSMTATFVAVAVPAVLLLGYRGGKKSSESALQLFSFMMVLAITMQISVAFVVLLDDCPEGLPDFECTHGTLTDAYLATCAIGAREMCKDVDNLPLGVSVLGDDLLDDLCECAGREDAAALDGSAAGAADDLATCVGGRMMDDLSVGKTEIAAVMILTMVIELILAYLAWGMMVDLDVKDAKKAEKLKGGPPVGKLRGKIYGGVDLLCTVDTLPEKAQAKVLKARKKAEKKAAKKGGVVSQMANRYAVLTLKTPDLDKKNRHHITQKTSTERLLDEEGIGEDDESPDWQHDFGTGAIDDLSDPPFRCYKGSNAIEIAVFDKDPKKKTKVLVGRTLLDVEGDTIPKYNYVMDGNEENDLIRVPLTWSDPRTKRKKDAGSIILSLIYVPDPPVVTNAVTMVTKTWYFESTVIGMVLVAMIVLGLQSPASPPDLMLLGTLQILEIFCATHMIVELGMEFSVALAAKRHKQLLRDPWFFLALVVLVCNWISIAFPAITPDMATATKVSEFLNETEVLESAAQTAAAKRLLDQATTGAGEVMGSGKIAQKLVSVGRVFRIVRPIRTLRMIRHVDIIVSVIQESVGMFLTVCSLLLFLLAVFALIGMSSFSGALQYQCVGESGDPSSDIPMPQCTPEQLSDARLMGLTCSGDCELPLYLDNGARLSMDSGEGIICPTECPHTLLCAEDHKWCAPLEGGKREIGGDRFGYRDFDDFWRGIVTMFVQTTGDGGMHIVPIALHEAGCSATSAAWLISFLGTIALNLLALNLFLAVCCSAYSNVVARTLILELERKRHRESKQKLLEERESEEDRQQRLEQEAADNEKLTVQQRIDALRWTEQGSSIAGIRDRCKDWMQSVNFERVTSLVIVGNTVTMALAKPEMPEEGLTGRQFLQTCETIFLVCFIVEALIKLLGQGWSIYFSSAANRFDVFVITASVVGFFATFFEAEIQELLGLNPEALQSLRAVRLLRALQIARLLHRQKALIVVLKTIFRAWKPLSIHSFFCVFSMSMFSIMGMHILGGSLGDEADLDAYNVECTANFETFGNGFITVFEMTVGEEWSHTMYWYMRYAHLGHSVPEFAVTVIFMAMYVWMNCILFSLCVAMLLENFAIVEEEKLPTQKRIYDRNARKEARRLKKLKKSMLTNTLEQSEAKGSAQDAGADTPWLRLTSAAHSIDDSLKDDRSNKSLFLFRLDSPMRLRAAKLQSSVWFSRVIMGLIMVSCISLAVEGPGEGATGFVQEEIGWLFEALNFLVLFAFMLEASLKIIIHGWGWPFGDSGPTRPFIASKMNQLDFTIIVLCIATYIPFIPVDGTAARALRLGRVITPMVNLSKNPEIRLVFISFVRAGPDTAVVLLPLVLMAVVFSILGVAMFGGQVRSCALLDDPLTTFEEGEEFPTPGNGTAVLDEQFCNRSGTVCFGDDTCDARATTWISPRFNFDSSHMGVATLLVALTDGAHEYMLETTEGNPATQGFWIIFHVVFTCFFLNLFIGVLSASFEKSAGSSLMSIGEKKWEAVQRSIQFFRPSRSADEDLRPVQEDKCCGGPQKLWWFFLRAKAYELATWEELEMVWRAGIMGNTGLLMFDQYPTSLIPADVIFWLNWVFLGVCTAEVVIKLVGFGARAYFKDGWMISDFILVSVSITFRLVGTTSGVEVLRVMRVFRMVVLASKLPSLVALIETLIKCLRASMALVLITSLIVYLYSIIGMNMFGLLPSKHVYASSDYARSNDVTCPELATAPEGDDEPADRVCENGECQIGLYLPGGAVNPEPDCPGLDASMAELRASAGVWNKDAMQWEVGIIEAVCPDCESFTDFTNFNDFPHSFRLLMQVAFGQEIAGFAVEMEKLGAEFHKVFFFFASFYMVTVWVCFNLLIVTVLSNFDKATTDGHTGEDAIEPIDYEGFAHCWASLTIGAHIPERVHKSEPALLEHLSEKMKKEAHDHAQEFVEPATCNPADGDPLLAGTLTIRIEKLDDLDESSLHGTNMFRPYVTVTAFGSATQTSKLEMRTHTARVKKGKASWKKKAKATEMNLDGTLNTSNSADETGAVLSTGINGM